MTSSVALFSHFRPISQVLIETGTWQGDGIRKAFESGFTQVYSCDINGDLVERSRKKFEGKNLQIFHLPSEDALKIIIKNLNARAVFFLDGHAMPPDQKAKKFSSETLQVGSENNPDLQCPIIRELEIIGQSSIKDHIILIDDRQCFQTWMFNYLSQSHVKSVIKSINSKYKFFYFENVLICTFSNIGYPSDGSVKNYFANILNRLL